MSESECRRSESVEESRRWWRRLGVGRGGALRGSSGGAATSQGGGLMGTVAAEPEVKVSVPVCRGGGKL
jgi:hypothetical protein